MSYRIYRLRRNIVGNEAVPVMVNGYTPVLEEWGDLEEGNVLLLEQADTANDKAVLVEVKIHEQEIEIKINEENIT